ncbi:MAG: hypothetical protein NC223_09125 [Butyrivibrio sp.]|nr:hypothetical protein [Butyrivibrio sp.]
MKGFFRKAAAVLLIGIMAVAMLAGCSKSGGKKVNASGADSMFGVIKASSQLEKKTFNCDITADIDGTTAKINLSGASDGKATSLSAEVSAGGMTFKFDNAVVFTDDTMYINVASVMDEVGSFAESMGESFDLESLGVTSDWVSFTAEGLFKQDTSIFDTIGKDLDEAYASIITEKDGTYSISVSDKDSVKGFLDATKKLLEDKSDSWAKLMADKSNSVDVEKIVNGLIDDVVNSIVKAVEEASGDKISDEQVKELKDAMLEETDMSEVEEIDEDSYKEMFDELKSELADVEAQELAGKIDVRTSYEKGVYTLKASIEADETDEDGGNITIVSTVTDDSSAKVEIPSDAQPLVDILAALLTASLMQ